MELVRRRGFDLGKGGSSLRTLPMISSAGLCQTRGLGSSFQCSTQVSMVPIEIGNTGEGAAAQASVGELLEPALHEVQPTRAGGREVQVPPLADRPATP